MASIYTAEHWRRLAAEAELTLCEATTVEARIALHKIVAGYLLLARHAESRERLNVAMSISLTDSAPEPTAQADPT
jgi:hypothetical protein